MKRFEFQVNVTVTRHEIYTVEAANMQEARNKAFAGETVEETVVRELGVTDRDIVNSVELE